jgi:LAS superfamily LD-carboxypeptidase LdcB
MLRSEFIRKIFPSALLTSSFIFKTNNFPIDELTGLTKPFLFGQNFQLRLEAANAITEMMEAAYKDGLLIWCSSSYRSFFAQKEIWNNKFSFFSKEIKDQKNVFDEVIKYSAIPGTSRHHWGTDIDVIDSLGYPNSYPLSTQNFISHGEYQYLQYWLEKNASKFDFYEVYTDNKNRTGFLYEPWHYSYAPLSKLILEQVLNYDFTKFDGFKWCKGNQFFTKNFIEAYAKTHLLGINPILKP